MSNDSTNTTAAAGPRLSEQLGLLNRLHSLKVLLGTDSHEVSGWAPFVQQGAQSTVNAAITELDRLRREVESLRADLKVAKGFADLWYFVSDEAPLEFESIVGQWPPSRWIDQAHKLMAARKPTAPAP